MEEFRLKDIREKADAGNVVNGDKYRITCITDRLIRFEYNDLGKFTDEASQRVLNRDLGKVSFGCSRTDSGLTIDTESIRITYDEKKFSAGGLNVFHKKTKGCFSPFWHYGKADEGNLLGTARTLDNVDGSVALEKGILSKDGFSVLDDSESLLLADGEIKEREAEGIDIYLFAYGHDYRGCLKDFFRITGGTPLLPKFVLGNWWSRYYTYTAEEYLGLFDRFEKERIPFSVSVIDMDWHLTEIAEEYGDGWTGYTWNRELFPDPRGFLAELKRRGLRVSLNVHPALGVRGHEDAYEEMAKAMGVDGSSKEPINFDMTDSKFVRAYFDVLHHPMEDEGVDFWWIDWQQGGHTKIKNLDPLWLLNHYHYLDSGRRGGRKLTFSRYAGVGSHRYPIGFSGDTVTSWASLDFQPYFTATASNIGYAWWSHDIGGHMLGENNEVMEVRWYQLGVFSPINRLHSTKAVFGGKEPYRFGTEAGQAMSEALRLRHRLLPYIYTMNYLSYKEFRPLISPMYYDYPEIEDAYPVQLFLGGGFKNEYLFGTDFIVTPITSDLIPSLKMGKVKSWIPEGIYHDFFTGLIYRGGRVINLYRGLESIPVLVRAGAIIPMQEKLFGEAYLENQEELTLRVYGGASGSFRLYEDDGESENYVKDGEYCFTEIRFDWDEAKLTIEKAAGNTDLLPKQRRFTVEIHGIKKNDAVLTVDGKEEQVQSFFDEEEGILTLLLPKVGIERSIELNFSESFSLSGNNEVKRAYEILARAQVDNRAREKAYSIINSDRNVARIIGELGTTGLPTEAVEALTEILTAGL